MKLFGIILVATSFLAGSFVTVLDPREVNWYYMIPALLAGLAGLWLYRKAQHQETRAGDKLAGNMAILHTSLANILRQPGRTVRTRRRPARLRSAFRNRPLVPR